MALRPHKYKELNEKSRTKIMKLEEGADFTPRDFEYPRIEKKGDGQYSHTKKTYGVSAATDQDRKFNYQKDAKFVMNKPSRESLAIEDEERRVIEDRVELRIEEVRTQAHTEGYNEGLAKGEVEGKEKAYQEFKQDGIERIKKIDEFLDSCEHAKEEIYRENEKFLIQMIYEVAESLALKEIDQDKEYIQRLTKSLVERTGVKENIVIRINPRDKDSISLIKENLEKALGKLQNLDIQVGDDVHDGGCVVETEWNEIDATIQTQLENMRQGMLDTHQTAEQKLANKVVADSVSESEPDISDDDSGDEPGESGDL